MSLHPDESTGLDEELATTPVGGPNGDTDHERAEEESEEPGDGDPDELSHG